jgi:CCR4-NOT transcription complex subunit 1
MFFFSCILSGWSFIVHFIDELVGFSAKKFCSAKIEELCANPVPMNSVEQIQNIVMFLQRSEGLSKHVDNFMQMLSLMQSKDVVPFVLTPLISDELREANFLR